MSRQGDKIDMTGAPPGLEPLADRKVPRRPVPITVERTKYFPWLWTAFADSPDFRRWDDPLGACANGHTPEQAIQRLMVMHPDWWQDEQE